MTTLALFPFRRSDLSRPFRFECHGLATVAAVAALNAMACNAAHADCFDEAAAYHHVNPHVLRAIAWVESRNRPDARNVNQNGSIDYGVMQVNSIHLRKLSEYGVDASTLMEPCKNVYIAAWHLRKQVDRYGNTWAAVGAYHSATPTLRDGYAAKVQAVLRRWGHDTGTQ